MTACAASWMPWPRAVIFRARPVRKFNAENDLPTAHAIAKEITGGGFDMAISVSTPCLQIMASANQAGKVMHVFGAVTDPFGAGVGINRANSLDRPAHLGDRLIMLHKGSMIQDIGGADKRRLQVEDLLNRFDEIRRAEQLDQGAAELLGQQYI